MFERLAARFSWLDNHHRIERFGVMFGTLCLAFIVLLSTIVMKSTKDHKNRLSEQVVYSTQFVSSISGLSGKVNNVFISKDHTQAFILLKFDDKALFSTNAEDYRFYVTGAAENGAKQPLQSRPSGSLYMFGSTGYMGLYLVDNGVFPSQILDVIVRCNVVLNDTGDDRTNMGESFRNNDQFRLYFNPGASGITTCEFLENGTLDAYSIYEEVVVRPREQALRETLDADLLAMKTSLDRLAEYKRELESAENRILVLDAPTVIRDDQVIADENGNLKYVPGETETVAAGFNFDWRGSTIRDGYLDSLVTGESASRWLASKAQETELYPFTNEMRAAREKGAWKYTDGSMFVVDVDGTPSLKNINDKISRTMSEWESYFNMKTQYQTVDLKSLLLLEIEALDVQSHHSVNTSTAEGNEVLKLW